MFSDHHVETLMQSSLANEHATQLLALTAIAALGMYSWSAATSRNQKSNFKVATTKAPEKAAAETIPASPGGLITIYFGSQTGTAEAFARELQREGQEHGFTMRVKDLQELADANDLIQTSALDAKTNVARAIIVTSTYGEGEAPDNAVDFVKAVQQASQLEGAATLEYCVFGLGNSTYEHFVAMGKFFDRELERIGGTRILDLGVGDDDKDLEGDFENWKDKLLWPALESRYLVGGAVSERPASDEAQPAIPDCPYEIEYVSADSATVPSLARNGIKTWETPVKTIRELRTPEDGGSTVHLELDITKSQGFSYEAADNLAVFPLNTTSNVESVARSLGYDLDQAFSLQVASGSETTSVPFSAPISVRDCLTRFLDLNAAPRRADLKLYAAFAKDPAECSELLRLASKDGKDEYRSQITDQFVGVAEFLQRYPSIEIPLEHFINICPLIQARFYTISSSPLVNPDSVHLTVTVETANREDGSIFKGLCSGYLASLMPEDHVEIYVRPSTFRLPKEAQKPILMIGPGTGIAPMRALLQERSFQRHELNQPVGPNVLYFGCKKASQDYLYQDELASYQNSGDLEKLYVAFSRQGAEKVYVQHLLAKNANETWDLIRQDGTYIYVCGATRMGRDVSQALTDIAVTEGGLSLEDATALVASLAKQGRLVQELWA